MRTVELSDPFRIYIARAVDGIRDHNLIFGPVERARAAFPSPQFDVVDPLGGQTGQLAGPAGDLIADQVGLLQTCDALLVDMTIPNRLYVGCIAEIVYACSFRLHVVVYHGKAEVQARPWLDAHVDFICHDWADVVEHVTHLRAAGPKMPTSPCGDQALKVLEQCGNSVHTDRCMESWKALAKKVADMSAHSSE